MGQVWRRLHAERVARSASYRVSSLFADATARREEAGRKARAVGGEGNCGIAEEKQSPSTLQLPGLPSRPLQIPFNMQRQRSNPTRTSKPLV
jgi:hypothetical protein